MRGTRRIMPALAIATALSQPSLPATPIPAPQHVRKLPDTTAIAGQIFTFRMETVVPHSDPLNGIIYSFKRISGPSGFMFPIGTNYAFWEVPLDAKTDTMVYAAYNNFGDTVRDTFRIDIDHTPLLSVALPADTSIQVGQELAIMVRGTDPDGDKVRYSLLTELGNMRIDAAGKLTYTATMQDTGLHRVRVALSDPAGAQTNVHFDLSVVASGAAARHLPRARGCCGAFAVTMEDNRVAVSLETGAGMHHARLDLVSAAGRKVSTLVHGSVGPWTTRVVTPPTLGRAWYAVVLRIDGAMAAKAASGVSR